MKILLLGAAGFIGTNLTIELAKKTEDEITLVDRSKAFFKPIVSMDLKNVHILEADLTVDMDFDSILKDQEVVYHLVSTTVPTTSNQHISQELVSNVIFSANLFEACIRCGVKKVVFVSSGGTVCPTYWNRVRGFRNVSTKWEKKDPVNGRYMWDFSVIKDILMNPVYTGAIASQKKEYRFKIGTIGEKKPEEWIVVENQHEPLVDRKTFDIVQRKLKSRQRPRQTGEISLFAGLIKCGECGKSLTIRYTNDKHPKQIYSCKTYNAYGKQHCTQHRVEYDTLYSLVLNKIRECARAALMDGEAVAGKLTDTCEAEQKGQREALERSLTKDEERIDVLEKMVLRLYEDMVAGRISEANFNLLMEKTQAEQAELKAKVEEGRKKLADEIRLACDARQWVEAIQEYADITELDAATLNRLIKEIVVHESIDSEKTRHISIEIHFNLKPIPEVEQVTA